MKIAIGADHGSFILNGKISGSGAERHARGLSRIKQFKKDFIKLYKEG